VGWSANIALDFNYNNKLCPPIKFEAFKLNNSFYNIMFQCLTADCHVSIVSIVHCWEVVKSDIAGQDRKSGGGVLLTGLGLKYSD